MLGVVAAVVAAAVLVGYPNHRNSGPSSLNQAVATTTTVPPDVAPLTGLLPADPSSLSRPAIDMKIDDDYYARPQSGINQADLVYEEVVEGGITRWLAVFQSHGASTVGPVRSVRQTDAELVSPIGGLFAYSGGIPAFVADVMATGVKDVGATTGDPSAYYRDTSRLAPDNLYTSTSSLWQAAPSGLAPPPPLFSYRTLGTSFDAAGMTTVGSVSIQMSGVTTVGWQWDPVGKVWDRSEGGRPSVDASGQPIAFTNLIIEYVPYHDTGYVDPAGNPVPDAKTVGTGEALVFSGGEVARATWSKSSARAITRYRQASGQAVELEPGNTWVELLPTTQPAPTCSGGSGLASQLCLSVVPPPATSNGLARSGG